MSGFRIQASRPCAYRTTPVFYENSLPFALRERHGTKAGVWGLVRVLEGRLKLTFLDPLSEVILESGRPGVVQPEQSHLVTPLGSMKIQIEFYKEPPLPDQ